MIEIFAHRAIYQNKENSLDGIENNLKLGYNIEIDVRKNNSGVYLSHDVSNNKIELFENACKIIKNYNKKVAIHIKEKFDVEEVIDLILKYNIGKKCFIFNTMKQKFSTEQIDVAIYQNNYKIQDNAKIFWCDESDGVWYNEKWFNDNKKSNITCITMSRELLSKSNLNEIKIEWNRLSKLGTDGICTDFPNELKKFVSEEL